MNPELRRNLWLELSLHRLVATPAALLLGFLLVFAISDSEPLRNVAYAAAWSFMGLTTLWGTRMAADAVIGEQRARTWDLQRMSALEPWAMTWGKLFGATAFCWYGGLICLMVFLLTAGSRFEAASGKLVALMIVFTVTVHAVALDASLTATRKALSLGSGYGLWILVILIFMFGPVLGLFSELGKATHWWGWDYARVDFVLGSAVVFAAWAVLGAYRVMCQELQVRTTPWAWLAFSLFLAAYIIGFAVRSEDGLREMQSLFLIAGLLVSLGLTYLMLFSEPTGAVVLRRVLVRVRERQWRRALEETPCWSVSLALALLFSVLTALFAGAPDAAHGMLGKIVYAPLPLFLLLVRDVAIFLFFAFSRQPKRVEAATVFYLALLYWLAPGLLDAVGADGAAQLVLPPVFKQAGLAAIVALAQAAMAVGLMLWRWRRNHGA